MAPKLSPVHGAPIVAVAMAVPTRRVQNAAIAAQVGVDESWIAKRDGHPGTAYARSLAGDT